MTPLVRASITEVSSTRAENLEGVEREGFTRGVLPITAIVLGIALVLGIAAGSTVVTLVGAVAATVALTVSVGVDRVDERLRAGQILGQTSVGAVLATAVAVAGWIWVVVVSGPSWRVALPAYWTLLAAARIWRVVRVGQRPVQGPTR
jgi:hypothetical protein